MTNLERTLKKIRKFINRFGVDINLLKREDIIDPIAYNSVESADKYWKSVKNKQIWDSAEYKEFYTLLIDELVQRNHDLNSKEWADVGCGSGTLLIYLKEKYKPQSIWGFEVAQSALDITAERLPEARLKVYNLYETPSEQFDVIFCTEVLEHLLHPDLAIQNLQKRMRANSTLIITVPNGRVDTWNGHINFWSPESWAVFIEKNVNGKVFETGKIDKRALFAIISNKTE
jgi:2-polyprenyl-3-methyl-5-hydroxy-6-metoxy-1,4-benzoquinol methylase